MDKLAQARRRIILAVDVPELRLAVTLLEQLAGKVKFKVGLELIHRFGPRTIFQFCSSYGVWPKDIFYDCKLHDIPNTVARAARHITAYKPWAFNVMAQGGPEMMAKAVDTVDKEVEGLDTRPLILAVTLLTSLSYDNLRAVGLFANRKESLTEPEKAMCVRTQASELARLAKDAGADGTICSPLEIEAIRETCGPDFLIVTPGVQPAGMGKNDQNVSPHPVRPFAGGADYLVIGRAITEAYDPAAAADVIAEEIAEALG